MGKDWTDLDGDTIVKAFKQSGSKSAVEAQPEPLNELLSATQAEEDKHFDEQAAKCGDYDNPENGYPKCSRQRVMLGDDKKHRCEKCAWCIEDNDFDGDFFRHLR